MPIPIVPIVTAVAKQAAVSATMNMAAELATKATQTAAEAIAQKANGLMQGKLMPESVLKSVTELGTNLQKSYCQQLKELSPCSETLRFPADNNTIWKRISPENVAEKRLNFNEIKSDLKTQWESANNQKWPKYTKDVYSDNGSLIRRAGDAYDAHHIRPLCMGGENTAGNITPMHAQNHYDKQGIHAPGSPYDQMTKLATT